MLRHQLFTCKYFEAFNKSSVHLQICHRRLARHIVLNGWHPHQRLFILNKVIFSCFVDFDQKKNNLSSLFLNQLFCFDNAFFSTPSSRRQCPSVGLGFRLSKPKVFYQNLCIVHWWQLINTYTRTKWPRVLASQRTHLKSHSGEKSNTCNQFNFASTGAGNLRTQGWLLPFEDGVVIKSYSFLSKPVVFRGSLSTYQAIWGLKDDSPFEDGVGRQTSPWTEWMEKCIHLQIQMWILIF